MKKMILFSIIFQLCGYTLFAQKYELKVNPGINFTFVPNFINRVLITHGGLIIPDLIVPGNSVDPPIIGMAQSVSTARLGFFVDLELGVKLGQRLKLSLICGLNQMKFDYDTYVDFDDAPPAYLSELDPKYGNTKLLFIDLKPLNLSLGLFKNKLSLQGGLSFNFLIHSQQNNIIVRYTTIYGINGETRDIIDKLHFDSTVELNKILYGFQLRAAVKIIKPLDVFVTGQFYFNSIYEDIDSDYRYYVYISDTKPIQLQFGLSYTFWNFGQKTTK